MAVLERPICTHCGHQFRTGQAPDAPRPDDRTLNRTMQFSIPMRLARPAAEPESIAPAQHPWGWLFAAALLFLALFAAFVFLRPHTTPPSPVGAWETTLSGKAAQNARLEFEFRQDGSGAFSWATIQSQARHGQVPLHWRLDATGKLVLALSPPPNADAVSGTLITIFGSHPWLWRLDSPRHRLVMGTLVFQHF